MEDGIAEECRSAQGYKEQVQILVEMATPLREGHDEHAQKREQAQQYHHQGAVTICYAIVR